MNEDATPILPQHGRFHTDPLLDYAEVAVHANELVFEVILVDSRVRDRLEPPISRHDSSGSLQDHDGEVRGQELLDPSVSRFSVADSSPAALSRSASTADPAITTTIARVAGRL